MDFFIEKPKTALAAAPLLLYNPPLLDILPIYIIFMLLTPVFLWVAEKRGWATILSASACVWLLAQCNLRGWIYSGLAHWGFPIPLNEMGAFDVFGWQFLWIGGLALGEARFPPRWPKRILALCGAIAVILFVCRHTGFDALTGPALFDVLVDKWRLGILRLIDAAALGILLLRFGSPLGGLPLGRKAGGTGQGFARGLFGALDLLPSVSWRWAWAGRSLWPLRNVSILAITLAGLFVVAEGVERRREVGRSDGG